MAHDVFISYAIEDRRTAESVCEALEESGITCWYAPRDVPFGVDYEEAIVDGICNSRLVVLILSKYSNSSPHVRREIQNACAEETARPILPVRVDDVQLNKALRYYLSSAQWLDASTPPLEKHLERLVQQLRSRLPAGGEKTDTNPTKKYQPSLTEDVQPRRAEEDSMEEQVKTDTPPPVAPVRPGPVVETKIPLWIILAGVGIFVLIGLVVLIVVLSNRKSASGEETQVASSTATPTVTPTHTPTLTATATATATPTLTPTASPTDTPTPGQTQAELEQACFNLVQGQIAWNYTGSKTWYPPNIENLCRRTTQPREPGVCFRRVMHGGINNGTSTKWQWQDALKLCAGTNNAQSTISCFTTKLAENIKAPAAIDACHR